MDSICLYSASLNPEKLFRSRATQTLRMFAAVQAPIPVSDGIVQILRERLTAPHI